MRYFPILILVFLISSCGIGGGGPLSYEEIGIYEYDISKDSLKLIKKIGENETVPFLRYFNDSKKIIYGRYNVFTIINETGKEEIINLDTLWIDDEFFSISPNNKYLAFGGTVILKNPNTGTIYKDRGLYLYDLELKSIKLLAKDSINPIKYPVFSNSGDKILYKSKAYQNAPSALFICDLNGDNIKEIANNDYDALKYGFFSTDDKNVIYIERPDKIKNYNIENQLSTVLIDNLVLIDGINTKEYPLLNVDKNIVYYYSKVADSTCSQSQVYKFDLDLKQTQLLNTGMAPMSITSDYVLIRDSKCSGFEASNLKLIDKNGNLIKTLSNGYRGVISNDNTKIVYIYSETKLYDHE